jgi:hypothetical protein
MSSPAREKLSAERQLEGSGPAVLPAGSVRFITGAMRFASVLAARNG